MSKSHDIAARIARHASALGYSVTVDGSQLSESHYVTARLDDDASVKVRVSGHDLPPSYGAPGDVDVHAGDIRPESVSWAHAVAHLARLAGRQVPAAAAREIARQDATAQARQAERASREASRAVQSARATADTAVAAFYPAEWRAAEALTGADRREAKRLLRRRYESENLA